MKTIILNKKLQNLTEQEFSRRCRDLATLVLGIPEYRESFASYIHNQFVSSGPRGEVFPYDAVSEIGLKDAPGNEMLLRSSDSRDRVTRAEAAFLDRDRSLVFQATENIILQGRAPIKLMIFSKRNPDLTHSQYVEHWSTQHVRVLRSQDDFYRHVRGYRQNYIQENSFRTLSGETIADPHLFDGVVELWFDSTETARRAFAVEGYQTVVRADEPKFVHVGKSIAFVAEEIIFG